LQARHARLKAVRAAAAAPTAQALAGTSVVSVSVPDCALQFGEHLRLVGSCAELGAWDAAAAPMLTWQEGNNWTADLALPPGQHSFKLVVVRGDGGQQWENGGNRELSVPAMGGTAPTLRAVCRFGDTAAMAVEELAPAVKVGPCWQASMAMRCDTVAWHNDDQTLQAS
jgi:hypothetical protein